MSQADISKLKKVQRYSYLEYFMKYTFSILQKFEWRLVETTTHLNIVGQVCIGIGPIVLNLLQQRADAVDH